jgi:hypothetical protein
MLGKLFIPPDFFSSKGTYIDTITGLITSQIVFPSGEQGSWIPSARKMIFGAMGSALLTDKITEIQLLDDTLTSYFTDTSLVIPNHSEFAPFTNNRAHRFYVVQCPTSGSPATVKTIDDAGVIGGTTWTLPLDSAHVPQGASVNLLETILYYGSRAGFQAKIHRWNLLTDTALSDFYTGILGEILGADIYTLADDSIIFSIRTSGNTWEARHYSSTGVLLQTYALGISFNGSLSPPRICLEDDELTLWAMTFPVSDMLTSRFIPFNVATGVAGTSFDLPNFNASPTFAYRQDNSGALSQSCPFFFISDVPAEGTIIVNKVVTYPTLQEFAIVAGGGLLPASISLADGESQVYLNVPAGSGYSFVETVPTGWTVNYAVSNGSPINNITVGIGETVTVTIINSFTPNARSGIYKIVPGKRQDTLWNEDLLSTFEVKIP